MMTSARKPRIRPMVRPILDESKKKNSVPVSSPDIADFVSEIKKF